MDPSTDEIYLAWAMISIGVGIAALFALMLGGGFDGPEHGARSFLVASALGLVAVIGGLVVLVRRSRAA